MKIFIIVNLLIILVASCSSHMTRQEEQVGQDTFDRPIGVENPSTNPYMVPNSHQPR
jgi:hypothetical protein